MDKVESTVERKSQHFFATNKFLVVLFIILLVVSSASFFVLLFHNNKLDAENKDLKTQLAAWEDLESADSSSGRNSTITRSVTTDPFDYVLVYGGGVCNSGECLLTNLYGQFEGEFFGYTTLNGYYSVGGDEPEGEGCEYFTTPDLDNGIISDLVDQYSWWEPEDGQIRFVLEPDEKYLDGRELGLLRSSSGGNPVNIVVSRSYPAPVDSGKCSSLFNLLSVKSEKN